MYLRRLPSLLRISQRNLVRTEDFPKLFQICLRAQNYSVICHESIASQLEQVKYLSQRRLFSSVIHPQVESISKTEQEIIVQGNDVPEPCSTFSETNLEEYLLQELQRLGFEKPTTIQSYCIPVALDGRDVVGIGRTGSGKTLAYLLPAFAHLRRQGPVKSGEPPTVLILAPTRELAQQINEVVRTFRDVCKIRSTCVFGGVSKGPQINFLSNGVNVCIATPGRLIDLLEMGVTNLKQVSYLVLDEADRMLDMGFEPQIRKIIDKIPGKPQTLMWSATWPLEVKGLAKDFLYDPVHITVGSEDLMANPNISQNIHICDEMQKLEKLHELLAEILSHKKNKVLIFAETKAQVDSLTRNLVWEKIPASCLHGDKSQLQRDKAVRDFKMGTSCVLIATDVAARGLDITDITHVINYDFPRVTDTYVHRIGRTGRADRTGTAHSFFTPQNKSQAKELVDVLKKCNQTVNPELLDMVLSAGPQKRSSLLSYVRQEYKDQDNFNKFRKPRSRGDFRYGKTNNYESKRFGSFNE